MTKKEKTFICRFRLPDGMYTMVTVSGTDVNEENAKIRSIDYMRANGRIASFVTAYEATF